MSALEDHHPAVSATAASLAAGLLVVVAFAGVQTGVAAVVTDGKQPVAQTATVPADPTADAWADAPSRTVTLNEQRMAVPYGGGSVDEMEVAALTNETHVAFRLTWEDPTEDTTLESPTEYSDGAAIMLGAGEQPPITMGQTGEPVNIWYWRASWQFSDHNARDAGGMYGYPEESQPGRMAGNPLSQDGYGQYAQNYYASGYGSLSHAPAQNVHATGERTDDGWQVVFVRERATDGQHDAPVDGSEPVYLAYAVWNGSAEEVNGKKSLTLQYSKLSQDGTLEAADGGADGESSTEEADEASASEGSGAGLLGGELGRYLQVLLLSTTLAWLYSYWKLRGEDR